MRKHELWGGGSYIYTNVDPSIHASSAFEAPATPGVKFHHLLTVQLLAGLIDHVINATGAVTPGPVAAPSFVIEFPSGNEPPSTTPTTPPPTTTMPTTTTPTSTPPTTTTPPTSTTSPAPATSTTPTPPAGGTPTSLRAGSTSNSATLTWTGDPGVAYDVLRGEDGVKIGSVTGTTFTDGGLIVNTPYVYSVRGPGGTTPQITVTPGITTTTSPPGTTAPSTTVPSTTPAVSTTSPPTSVPPAGAPSNLHLTGKTSSTITIGWTGPAGGTYDILRGEAGDKIASVTGNSFTDVGLLPGTPYVYSVRGLGVTTPQITLTLSSPVTAALRVMVVS